MGSNPSSYEENQIIDLTESDDNPINPLCQPDSSPSWRRKRRHSEGSNRQQAPRNDDNDIEVVSISHNESPRIPAQRRRRLRLSNQYSPTDDGLDVVDEKRLTPQERLRRIQEQHARGEVVQPNQPQERHPFTMPPFGPYHNMRGGPRLMAPQGFHPYLMPPQSRMPGYNIGGYRYAPYGLFGGGFNNGGNLEQSIVDRTLEASINETDYSKRLDTNSLMLPPPPSLEARPGFTKTLATDAELVCIKCDHPLGKPRDDLTSTARLQSQKVFTRGCGHVYCGQCTFSMKDRSNKDKACPVEECRKVPPKKRGLFREVFL